MSESTKQRETLNRLSLDLSPDSEREREIDYYFGDAVSYSKREREMERDVNLESYPAGKGIRHIGQQSSSLTPAPPAPAAAPADAPCCPDEGVGGAWVPDRWSVGRCLIATSFPLPPPLSAPLPALKNVSSVTPAVTVAAVPATDSRRMTFARAFAVTVADEAVGLLVAVVMPLCSLPWRHL